MDHIFPNINAQDFAQNLLELEWDTVTIYNNVPQKKNKMKQSKWLFEKAEFNQNFNLFYLLSIYLSIFQSLENRD